MLSASEKPKSGLDSSVRKDLELLSIYLFVNGADLYGQIQLARDIGIATGNKVLISMIRVLCLRKVDFAAIN
jgi:hypothetical protein